MPGTPRHSCPAAGLPLPRRDPSSDGKPFWFSSPWGNGERDTLATSTPLFSPTAATGVSAAAVERKQGQSSRNEPTQEARSPGLRQTKRRGQKETWGPREPDRGRHSRLESAKNRLSRSRGQRRRGVRREKILEEARWGEEGRGCETRGQRREEEREKQRKMEGHPGPT